MHAGFGQSKQKLFARWARGVDGARIARALHRCQAGAEAQARRSDEARGRDEAGHGQARGEGPRPPRAWPWIPR